MKKKGLILIPFLTGYGGTETVIRNLLNEYNKEKNKYNIRLKLYSLGGFINGDWLKFPNVRIFQFPKERYVREFLYLFILPFLVLYSILKERPNFVISTNPIIWTIAKLVTQSLNKNIKVVAWYHYSYKLKPVNNYCLNKPDYFFTISKTGKKELIDLGVASQRVFVVYNPVIPTRQIIKPSKHHNQFIYVGRLEYKGSKNISELFSALSLLKNRTWHLDIYGVGTDENKLKCLSKRLNINSNITWKGFIENPLNKVKYADALLLTSTNEGFSMVIAEALSRGLYVISSDCQIGPRELIDSSNGCLYPLGDVKRLSLCISSILNNKVDINQVDIKHSISRFYIPNYYYNFVSYINSILERHIYD